MLAFLAAAPLYVVPFLLVITLIVTIHELGHFLTARACGVAVDRFSIGFGPAIASFRDKWGVEWRLAWFPLGGYVRFAGDDNEASVPDSDDLDSLRLSIIAREGAGAEKRYFAFKPLWQRALVVIAGPAANFVLAIALFAMLYGAVGEPVTKAPILKVEPGSAAAQAGFQPGDSIVAADGRSMRGWEDIVEYIAYRDGVPIDFTVQRGAQQLHLLATPGRREEASLFGGSDRSGLLGVGHLGTMQVLRYDPISAIGRGTERTWQVIETTGFFLGRIVTGHAPANQLHGLTGMVKASGSLATEAVSSAPQTLPDQALALVFTMLQLSALLSITIGLVNLLPIPVLDGGHLLFYAYEAVVRRPLSANIQAAGYRVGLALLVGMMLFANWNDLQRLRVFHFLGGPFS